MLSFNDGDDIEKILHSLNELEDKLQNKAVRSGLVSVAAPIKQTMKSEAPKKSGRLAQSINHRMLNKRQKSRLNIDANDVAIVVGPNKKVSGSNVSWKAVLIEDGTKPHTIRSKHKTLKMGGDFVGGSVSHPGIKSNPFMGRSIEQNQSDIESRFYKGMAKMINRIVSQ